MCVEVTKLLSLLFYQAAFGHVASAARTANRVVAITKGEAENSTDVNFKGQLDSSSVAVTTGMITPTLKTYYYLPICASQPLVPW